MLFNAIEIEEGYLKLLSDREAKRAYDLRGKLLEEGYAISQYHDEKDRFIVEATKHEFRMTTPETVIADELSVIAKGESVIFLSAGTKPWAYISAERANIPETGYDICYLDHPCNNVYSTDKDLNFVIVVKHHGVMKIYEEMVYGILESVGITEKDVTIATEKPLGDYSVYYIQVYFDRINGVTREAVINKCLP